jgi:hypothetical protein
MGCCFCHPRVSARISAEQDPSAKSITEVEEIAVTRGACTVFGPSPSSGGVLYIREDSLHYEGENGCCSRQFKCKLTHIEFVDLFDNQRMSIGCRSIQLSPGLRISIDPNTTVFVAMHSAARLAPVLADASNAIARSVRYGKYTESYKIMPKMKKRKVGAAANR